MYNCNVEELRVCSGVSSGIYIQLSIFSNDLSASCACTLGQWPHVAPQQIYIVLKETDKQKTKNTD